MYSINNVQIEGNLTRDPETKALPSGATVTTFSIATNRKWNDKEGKLQEDTQYHNIVFYGKQAEVAAKYLQKGSSAYVQGRLETRSWETDGVKQYRTEIVGENLRLGAKPQTSNIPNTNEKYPEEDINPEDIPF